MRIFYRFTNNLRAELPTNRKKRSLYDEHDINKDIFRSFFKQTVLQHWVQCWTPYLKTYLHQASVSPNGLDKEITNSLNALN